MIGQMLKGVGFNDCFEISIKGIECRGLKTASCAKRKF